MCLYRNGHERLAVRVQPIMGARIPPIALRCCSPSVHAAVAFVENPAGYVTDTSTTESPVPNAMSTCTRPMSALPAGAVILVCSPGRQRRVGANVEATPAQWTIQSNIPPALFNKDS
jgi:hypothetical protein